MEEHILKMYIFIQFVQYIFDYQVQFSDCAARINTYPYWNILHVLRTHYYNTFFESFRMWFSTLFLSLSKFWVKTSVGLNREMSYRSFKAVCLLKGTKKA